MPSHSWCLDLSFFFFRPTRDNKSTNIKNLKILEILETNELPGSLPVLPVDAHFGRTRRVAREWNSSHRSRRKNRFLKFSLEILEDSLSVVISGIAGGLDLFEFNAFLTVCLATPWHRVESVVWLSCARRSMEV